MENIQLITEAKEYDKTSESKFINKLIKRILLLSINFTYYTYITNKSNKLDLLITHLCIFNQ